MRKSIVVIAAAALLAAGGVVLTQSAFAGATPAYHPTRLKNVGNAQQLIVVTGAGAKSTYSTLRTYQLGADGTWAERFPAMAARNGYGGWVWSNSRIQGTGTTPAGTFSLRDAFGLSANPGTKITYRHADSNDYWVGDNRDAKTYNLVQTRASPKRTWRTTEAERLAAYPTQYEYALVVDFNRPHAETVKYNATRMQYETSKPMNVRRGSAIFLHVNGAGSTAGCVSVSRANMLNVLRWLDPAKKPRLVMAPLADIGKA